MNVNIYLKNYVIKYNTLQYNKQIDNIGNYK